MYGYIDIQQSIEPV